MERTPDNSMVPSPSGRPLTTPQAGIWLELSDQRRSSEYNVCNLVRFRGDLDPDALFRAIARADGESDVQRLRFSVHQGVVCQHLAEDATDIDFAMVDVHHTKDPVAAAWEEVQGIRARPFDPENGRMCRHRIVKVNDQEHWWVRCYHHLICDGYSGLLLCDRTELLYNAEKRGDSPPPPTFGAYADFITRDHAYPQTPAYRRDIAYWRERLAEDHAITRFGPAPDDERPLFAEHRTTLAPDRLEALHRTARECDVSPTAILLTIYLVLLARTVGTRFPTCLMPLLNRLGRDERATPGTFSCVVPFTTEVEDNLSFTELAGQVFKQVRRDVRHMRFSPPHMRAEGLAAKGLSSPGGAIFNSLDDARLLDFSELDARRVNVYNGPVDDVNLMFFIHPTGNGTAEGELIWQYNARYFDPTDMEHIADRFHRLLDGAMADPHLEIGALPLIGTAESARIKTWETGPAIAPSDQTPLLPARIADILSRHPDQTAILEPDGRSIPYGELKRMASRMDAALSDAGIARGQFVGLCITPGAAQVAALLAIWQRGAAVVPLDPMLPPARLSAMAGHLQTRRVLCDRETASMFPISGSVPGIDITTLLSGDAGRLGAEPAHVLEIDTAIVYHTSGSTGKPKPVAISHGALTAKAVSMARYFDMGHIDKKDPETICVSPSIGFDPWIQQVMIGLLGGGTLWMCTREELADGIVFWRKLASCGVTHLNTVPSVVESLIHAIPDDARFSLRRIVLGGEVLHPETVMQLLILSGCDLVWNAYGPTEATVDITAFKIPAGPRLSEIPIGRVLPGGVVRVLDPHGRRVPVGVTGELYIGGTCLSDGYIGMTEKTRSSFMTDPTGESPSLFYRSGDRVIWDRDGTLRFRGRNDNQIKIRGQRLEPEEVETLLRNAPGVTAATVVYRPDGHGGRLTGFVTGRVDPDVLRRRLADQLPNAAVPARIRMLAELPQLPSGKVDRKALDKMADGPLSPPPPQTGQQPDPRLQTALDARHRALRRGIAEIWSRLIGCDTIDPDANLFEMGAQSLMVPRAQVRLSELAGRDVGAVEIFRYPTVAALARHLAGSEPETLDARPESPAAPHGPFGSGDIAVVGMGLRVPGGDTREAFWSVLKNSEERIVTIDAQRLERFGQSPSLLEDPSFVPRHGVLADIDAFDPAPFGMHAGEVVETDPQHRLLLEVALAALEDSCCDPRIDGPVGVFAGVGFPTYLVDALGSRLHNRADTRRYAVTIGNDKDYAATRLSYKLNLTGPAVSSSTACSTGLANVILAVQALRTGQCRVALAGGASLGPGCAGGYHYADGGIGSRSGVCRPFDHLADGVVGGSGAAMVVLKRLEDALADGDTLHGIVKGVGLTNDGSAKAAFTAPSVDGQAAAMRAALADAAIRPSEIRFVEGHGTATALGDPIEVAALNLVYGADPAATPGSIWLGSVKGNIGHIDAAAGVAGLIKALLALTHRTVPPVCHFKKPNPRIALDQGPFHVNHQAAPIRATDGEPLRGAVSSYGIGGTNAHLILEAPPDIPPPTLQSPPASRPQLLLFSAATETSRDGILKATERRLAQNDIPATDLPHIAFSLRKGRRRYPHRTAIVANTPAEARTRLLAADAPLRADHGPPISDPWIAFLFPGTGAQYPGMARDLYRGEPAVRDLIDAACKTATILGGPQELRDLLLCDPGAPDAATAMAGRDIAGPALFIFDYAVSRLLIRWGLKPAALAGDGIGEYAAACIAGMISFDDALRLAILRGKIPRNAGTSGGPAYDEFCSQAGRISFAPPQIPILSDVTGDWLDTDTAPSSDYWLRHLHRPGRFADTIHRLVTTPDAILIECGPGNTTGRLARARGMDPARTIATQPPETPASGHDTLMMAVGRAWTLGIEADWSAIEPEEGLRRLPLPTYVFDRRRFWPERASVPPPDEKRLPEAVPDPTENETDLLETILGIWRDVFGDPAIGPNTDFLEIGGDSLTAVRIASMVVEFLGTEIPTAVMLEGLTPAHLATLITGNGNGARGTLPPGSPVDAPPPTREQGVL